MHRHSSRRTKSLLLGTATPVQINPIEAWDLLNLLNTNREHVLGNVWSEWNKPAGCLPVISGEISLSEITTIDFWNWFRNPVPPANEHRDFETLRRVLGMSDDQAISNGSDIDKLKAPDRSRLERLKPGFGREHNPFLRHIIRRTRDFLETEKDSETNQPYLDPVYVKLLGEGDEGAVELSPYLKEAYKLVEGFCAAIARYRKGAGFLKTLLFRRAGSSVVAPLPWNPTPLKPHGLPPPKETNAKPAKPSTPCRRSIPSRPNTNRSPASQRKLSQSLRPRTLR